jgi:hypothetical protein
MPAGVVVLKLTSGKLYATRTLFAASFLRRNDPVVLLVVEVLETTRSSQNLIYG